MSTAPHEDSAPRPRRRGAALLHAIYLTTLEELAHTSFEELSFDKIATKAGAGKASLYRRWSSPAELVLAALADPVTGFAETPDPRTGSLRDDLVAVLSGLAAALDEPQGRALRPLLTQSSRHPELYERVFQQVVEPRQELLLRILRAGAERGEADPDAITPRIAAVGPRLVIVEHVKAGTVPRSEVESIVDEVLLRLLAPRR
ncbi:TetR/AcrR family transcriptional regulator [Saccharopolyspora sp. NPDC047091]|uniref:TetR-like C-terminal domain-containing protein n=1 Tax=Saccharopolyspora sp. NPDC047091 TaxID=3155924 RepID=UPI0033F15265